MQPRGIRNNNPLNIRKGNNWLGERHPQTDPEFEEFKTITDGCRAAVILAYNLIIGRAASTCGVKCRTLAALIRKWAPPSENNTEQYLKTVCKLTGYEPNKILFPVQKHVLCYVLWAMAQVECGQEIPLHHFENAFGLAFGSRG